MARRRGYIRAAFAWMPHALPFSSSRRGQGSAGKARKTGNIVGMAQTRRKLSRAQAPPETAPMFLERACLSRQAASMRGQAQACGWMRTAGLPSGTDIAFISLDRRCGGFPRQSCRRGKDGQHPRPEACKSLHCALPRILLCVPESHVPENRPGRSSFCEGKGKPC